MKIALVANAKLSNTFRQGAERIAIDVASALHSAGVLGCVYCYTATPEIGWPGVEIVPVLSNLVARKSLTLLQHAGRLCQSVPARRWEEEVFDSLVARRLVHEAADAVLFMKPINPASVRQARSRGLGTAVLVSTLHPHFNAEVMREAQEHLGIREYSVFTDPLRVRRLDDVLGNVDAILAESSFFRDNYQRYGVSPEKILTPSQQRPMGVDLSRFKPRQGRPDRFRVLHLSYMSLIKGIHILLDAWEQAFPRIKGELLLVGTMDATIRKLIEGRKLPGIRLAGASVNPVAYYQDCSLFVSPSISDAHPVTVFEAMACAVPCLVSDHCGASHYIQEGVTGHVYPYANSARLAELIVQGYLNQEALEKKGERARHFIRRYPLSEYASVMVGLALSRALSS